MASKKKAFKFPDNPHRGREDLYKDSHLCAHKLRTKQALAFLRLAREMYPEEYHNSRLRQYVATLVNKKNTDRLLNNLEKAPGKNEQGGTGELHRYYAPFFSALIRNPVTLPIVYNVINEYYRRQQKRNYKKSYVNKEKVSIAGAGYHAQLLINQVMDADPDLVKNIVIHEGSKQVGGQFAVGPNPAFKLNSQVGAFNPSFPNTAGRRGTTITNGDCAVVDPSFCTGDVYPDQNIMGATILVNLMLSGVRVNLQSHVDNISQVRGMRVIATGLPKSQSVGDDVRSFFSDAKSTSSAGRIRYSLLSNLSYFQENGKYMTSPDFFALLADENNVEPLESLGRCVAVIGDGDSAKSVVASLLDGHGTRQRMVAENILWIGQKSTNGRDFCESNRPRYTAPPVPGAFFDRGELNLPEDARASYNLQQAYDNQRRELAYLLLQAQLSLSLPRAFFNINRQLIFGDTSYHPALNSKRYFPYSVGSMQKNLESSLDALKETPKQKIEGRGEVDVSLLGCDQVFTQAVQYLQSLLPRLVPSEKDNVIGASAIADQLEEYRKALLQNISERFIRPVDLRFTTIHGIKAINGEMQMILECRDESQLQSLSLSYSSYKIESFADISADNNVSLSKKVLESRIDTCRYHFAVDSVIDCRGGRPPKKNVFAGIAGVKGDDLIYGVSQPDTPIARIIQRFGGVANIYAVGPCAGIPLTDLARSQRPALQSVTKNVDSTWYLGPATEAFATDVMIPYLRTA